MTRLFIFQKQYMFVYRAIMEMAQFGDTEVDAAEIKSVWQQLTDSSHSGITVSKNLSKKVQFIEICTFFPFEKRLKLNFSYFMM